MKDFFAKLDLVKELYRKRDDKMVQLKLDRERQVRLRDLGEKYHVTGDIALPLPSFFALEWLENWFDGFDKIDLNKLEHLSTVIFILEMQTAVDEISQMSKAQIKTAIQRNASEIPAVRLPEYRTCAAELFEVLKKNYLQKQQQMLEEVQRLLQTD